MIAAILSAFSFIRSNGKIVMTAIVGFALIALLIVIEIQRRSLDTMATSLLTTQQNLERIESAAGEYRASAEAQILAISQERNQALARQNAARAREREITNVPMDQDGPCAAVLCDSLGRLR